MSVWSPRASAEPATGGGAQNLLSSSQAGPPAMASLGVCCRIEHGLRVEVELFLMTRAYLPAASSHEHSSIGGQVFRCGTLRYAGSNIAKYPRQESPVERAQCLGFAAPRSVKLAVDRPHEMMASILSPLELHSGSL